MAGRIGDLLAPDPPLFLINWPVELGILLAPSPPLSLINLDSGGILDLHSGAPASMGQP